MNSVLMSQDVFLKMMLTRYGGFGYGYILKHFVPRLKRHGMNQATIDNILIENRGEFSPLSIARAREPQPLGERQMSDKRYKVLLAGESWVTTATHIKGFDQFSTVTFHLGPSRWSMRSKGQPSICATCQRTRRSATSRRRRKALLPMMR